MEAMRNFIFATLWTVFGSDSFVPPQQDVVWNHASVWESQNGVFAFKATSETLPALCKANPKAYVDFPMIINSAHEIYADGRLLLRFSDPSFRAVRSIYGKPWLNCSELSEARSVEWRTWTDAKYFARFTAFPQIEAVQPLDNFFNEILNIIAAGTLLIMGVFCLIIFAGKVQTALAISYFAANMFLAIYFVGTVPGLMALQIDILNVHRIGDACLWIGPGCFSMSYIYMDCSVAPSPEVSRWSPRSPWPCNGPRATAMKCSLAPTSPSCPPSSRWPCPFITWCATGAGGTASRRCSLWGWVYSWPPA
jgi:hypothetical protein